MAGFVACPLHWSQSCLAVKNKCIHPQFNFPGASSVCFLDGVTKVYSQFPVRAKLIQQLSPLEYESNVAAVESESIVPQN